MSQFSQQTTAELLIAMESFKAIARILTDKLISETDQPEKDKIKEGHYYEIENAPLLNGTDLLSGNWYFEVHGEHCLFKNSITGQTLEVSLGDIESVGNLDPYFFYNFLKTTTAFQHLTDNFKNPFSDMIAFFETLIENKQMIPLYGNEFRKV